VRIYQSLDDARTIAVSISSEQPATPCLPSAFAAHLEPLGYNQTQAARRCGISRTTLYKDTKLGRVHCNDRGIYARSELERYLVDTQVKNRTAPKRASNAGRKRKKRAIL
jgi:hypothetical protein